MDGLTDEITYPLSLPLRRAALRELDAEELEGTRNEALYRLAIRARQRMGADINPAEMSAAGLLHELSRVVAREYLESQVPGAMGRLVKGVESLPPTAAALATTHPPAAELSLPVSARELLLLRVAVENPALAPFGVLFGDRELASQAPYEALVAALEERLANLPPVRGLDLTLLDALREPARLAPGSLTEQLGFIRRRWAHLLPASLLEALLVAGDVLRESQRARGLGPGPTEALRLGPPPGTSLAEWEQETPERFTEDRDWMANVVLLAKLSHVWLDQLSRRYGRSITRLDQVPDEELDRLARWGFTGLWLIGLWERSDASADIKRRMGNAEALPSAYSLYDYEIAHDLGGRAAYDDLQRRAMDRGIRLAADMVPNHFGLFSKWVLERPDRFLQLDHPPYPGYRFTGPDLSSGGDIEIRIEDGYWNHSDAAVVFERVDKHSGQRRYIYHGNDGTQMPWNDTAQIDFLNPEAREAVVQEIMRVARLARIIRFDAAMTLAKQHIQRLWFPPPGEGGAIPSRAGRGVSREEFERLIPKEFWREVVDRIQEELPDTLLMAEAFWMMEGYFVRTLGMHRVYNSAFMNMLKSQENAKYRQTIRNVLEFSPPILQRFVNFMNNPDEETAVAQFGKEDRYFGVAMMMVTMPGLPMIGHGQVEAFTEKYGMEYRKAYRDERPDEAVVSRHEREIFPLMRRRWLFSQVDNFALFDFRSPDGAVNENVFAWTNRAGDQRALILYNNAFDRARGWIHTSTPINVGTQAEPHLVCRTLAEALGLRHDDGVFYSLRDHRTGQTILRAGGQLTSEGFYAELDGFHYQAWLDITERTGDDWRGLAHHLGGRPVGDLDEAMTAFKLLPVTRAFAHWLGLTLAGVDEEGALPAFVREAGLKSEPLTKAATTAADLDDEDRPFATALAVWRAIPQSRRADLRLHQAATEAAGEETTALLDLLADPDATAEQRFDAARPFLDVHEHDGVEYFNKERMETWLPALRAAESLDDTPKQAATRYETRLLALEKSNYRYPRFLDSALATPKKAASPKPPSKKKPVDE